MLKLPFDPIQRAHEVEQIVIQDDKRRYYRFRYAKFYGGIVTADAIGCNLLCAYCWNYSRNLDPSKVGTFYSPSEVAGKLLGLAKKNDCHKFRISGAEPILGRASALHLAEVIRRVDGHFIVETNGIMLGADPTLVEILEPLSLLRIRLAIKGDSPESFQKVTGANETGLELQLKAVQTLKDAKISHSVAIMPEFVDSRILLCRVNEREDLKYYGSTEANLRSRGL